MKAPEGRLMINTTGNAAMAKAGSGDVLAGMITGLMAQHMRPDDVLKMLGRTLKELEDMTE